MTKHFNLTESLFDYLCTVLHLRNQIDSVLSAIVKDTFPLPCQGRFVFFLLAGFDLLALATVSFACNLHGSSSQMNVQVVLFNYE